MALRHITITVIVLSFLKDPSQPPLFSMPSLLLILHTVSCDCYVFCSLMEKHICLLGKIGCRCVEEVFWSPQLFRTFWKQVSETKFWSCMWILQWTANMSTLKVWILPVEESCTVRIRVARTRRKRWIEKQQLKLFEWKEHSETCYIAWKRIYEGEGLIEKSKARIRYWEWKRVRVRKGKRWLPCLQPPWTLDIGRGEEQFLL